MPDKMGKFAPALAKEAEVVEDLVTGLVWQRRMQFQGEYLEAEAYCEELRLAGQTDWRLPSLIEIVSIIDTTGQKPAIDREAFPDEPIDNLVWGARTKSGDQDVVYVVYTGGAGHALKYFLKALEPGKPVFVRCVRGGKEAEGTRYIVNDADGVVNDRWTGLIWKRAIENGLFTLTEADARCGSHAGHWRLPTAKELATLVDPLASEPAIDQSAFPQTPSETFWSSSDTLGFAPAYEKSRRVIDFGALAVSPNIGIASFGGAGTDRRFRVRCVR